MVFDGLWRAGVLAAIMFATPCPAETLPPAMFGDNGSVSSDWDAKVRRGPVIMPGTGEVIGTLPEGVAVTEGKGDITLNFANADIREVVQAVLGDVLGLNYTLSPNVKGTVTVRTSRPLTRAAVFDAFVAVLRVQGATIVKVGNVYQVLPSAEAPRTAIQPIIRSPTARPPGYGIEVVPLKFIAAAQMEKVLASVVPENGILYVDSTRNLLLLGGTRDELASLFDIITIFDINIMRGMSFALVPLEHSEAEAVAQELERVFSLNQENPTEGSVKFMPIARLRSVLVIGPAKEYIDHAREWIKMLDRSDEAGQRLYVYYVQHGRAKDIASVLAKLFGAEVTNEPAKGDVAPGYTPAIIESPFGVKLPGLTNPAASTDTLPGKLSMAPPSKMSPTAPVTDENDQAAAVQFVAKNPVRIVAESNINALVIYASPADYGTIVSTLRKIDIAPMQVLIEATIAEVSLRGSFEYGLQWFFNSADVSLYNSGGTPGPLAAISPAFSYLATAQNIHVTLTALAQQTDVRIISSPQLMVLDNQTARIQVGDQVPVLSQQAVSTITAGAPIVNSVQYIDAGVILDVTPHVNSGGLVTLDITQQISQPVKTESSNIDSPTIQQRMIKSSVSVQSGQMVALGGLIAEKEADTGEGIPALRRIPVLGALFGVKGRENTRTELLVILNPKVIRDPEEAREVSYELGNRMRSLIPLGEKIQ